MVFPACMLNYLGQGALIIEDPDSISAPFFLLTPHWAPGPDGSAGHAPQQ